MAIKYPYDESFEIKGWFDAVLAQSGWFDNGFSETTGAPPASTGQIKVWNSSVFTAKPIKWYNGSTWVVKPLKYYNGVTWVTTLY